MMSNTDLVDLNHEASHLSCQYDDLRKKICSYSDVYH